MNSGVSICVFWRISCIPRHAIYVYICNCPAVIIVVMLPFAHRDSPQKIYQSLFCCVWLSVLIYDKTFWKSPFLLGKGCPIREWCDPFLSPDPESGFHKTKLLYKDAVDWQKAISRIETSKKKWKIRHPITRRRNKIAKSGSGYESRIPNNQLFTVQTNERFVDNKKHHAICINAYFYCPCGLD